MVEADNLDDLLEQLRNMSRSDSKKILSKLPFDQRKKIIEALKQKPKISEDIEENKEPKQSNKIFSAYSPWLANLLLDSQKDGLHSETLLFHKLTSSTQAIIKIKASVIEAESIKKNIDKPLGFFEYIQSLFFESGERK